MNSASLSLIAPFLDEQGRLKSWPSKLKKQQIASEYIASKLDAARTYSEYAFGEALNRWHTFNDVCLLRRALVDFKQVTRLADGSCYRLNT